ncbi:hypothetical protein J1N35_038363, partial [Gossypium stocksii]
PKNSHATVAHTTTLQPPHDCVWCTAMSSSITRPCHRTQPSTRVATHPCGFKIM